jgi:hypothetical protein
MLQFLGYLITQAFKKSRPNIEISSNLVTPEDLPAGKLNNNNTGS